MKNRKLSRTLISLISLLAITIAIVAMLTSVSIPKAPRDATPTAPDETSSSISSTPTDTDTNTPPETTATEPENDPVAPVTDAPVTDTPETPPPEEVVPTFEPYAVDGTMPDKMIATTAIMADGKIVSEYTFPDPIDFSLGHNYAQIEGIVTFRGNNFRDSPSYGYAEMKKAKFGDKWSYGTGSYTAPDGAFWSGNGWTGQPLIVKWPKRTREIMNMHKWAQDQDELVEIVFASMDGYVYFTELETGKPTRNKLYLGLPFKGSGALDPRGYPLLYVGAGYSGPAGGARILVVSLVDGSVLYTFGSGDSFAPRNWNAADGSALVDAETDNLIYPSENGTIYIIKLNSVFDIDAGTISIDPKPVKWRFTGKRSQSGGKFWLGMESSAVIWRGHLIITDNGGHIICLNINTLELVWVQDVLDDTNCTPVLGLEGDHPYVYVSTSFHGGWRASMGSSAVVPVWKIDAVTGEIVWQADYTCYTSEGVSGGVQGTAALGTQGLSGIVYIPIARTPTRGEGILAALNTETGEVVWEFRSKTYAWSSPVCVYDQNGKGYVIYCTAGGNMHLIDGLTGDILDTLSLGGLIEASPAVYNNTVVLGTRDQKTYGIKLT